MTRERVATCHPRGMVCRDEIARETRHRIKPLRYRRSNTTKLDPLSTFRKRRRRQMRGSSQPQCGSARLVAYSGAGARRASPGASALLHLASNEAEELPGDPHHFFFTEPTLAEVSIDGPGQ